MDEKTLEALSELAKAAARQMGIDDGEISFTVSKTTEPNVCDKHCSVCDGQTHHWMETFEEDEDGEIINPDEAYWGCKHCAHKVPYAEPDKHPSGCDCPDCFDDSECWLCSCGEFIENGLHCSTCGAEPPWGCPCSACPGGDEDDDDLSYSDVMREDWDY